MTDLNSWSKRDSLVEDEKKLYDFILKKKSVTHNDKPKKFLTFPYPYMNGRLHLGHALTISTLEFYSRFLELSGYNVLFPIAFHGTGMPIVACAKKLEEELKNNYPTKPQYDILISMGVDKNEINNFIDPYYWLKYFPKKAIDDLKLFGASCDFTREFITTDLNPYYDSFIKWQFDGLNKKNYLSFGKKPVIYCVKDGQVCSDHDRSKGEGVRIKDYILLQFVLPNNRILLAATTRIETMYGVTNLWINENMNYNIFSMNDEEYICSSNAFNNLKYQYYGENITLLDETISGKDIINFNKALLSFDKTNIFVKLCHRDIKIEKGTGIVASVPAHSVYDYEGWQDNDSIISAINIKDIGPTKDIIVSAFKSNNLDRQKLSRKINRLEKQKGFMSVGEYKGLLCEQARSYLEDIMLENKECFKYHEPEDLVISRSDEKCIVATIDQWFIDYSGKELTDNINNYINNNLNTFNDKVKDSFKSASNWIGKWACSRTTGLGTKLLDTSYLIDSLSDSTIYMAFYTISHIIKEIPFELIDNALWNYLFHNGNIKNINPNIDKKLIDLMKKEFNYWFPIDLRCSGRDLITNHLVMCLYSHYMIWNDINMMPKNYYVNGYVLLNNQKMAKSTGNFITLNNAIKKYGADATRLALVNANNGFEDGNFMEDNASSSILKLYTEKIWCKNMIDNILETDKTEYSFWDSLFDSEMNTLFNRCISCYEKLEIKEAINIGFYDLLSEKDNYINNCNNNLTKINMRLIKKYIELHLLLIYPICPFYVEHIWQYSETKGIIFKRNYLSFNNLKTDHNIIYKKDRLEFIQKECRSRYIHHIKKNINPTNMIINIFGFNEEENKIINNIKTYMDSNLDWKTICNKITFNIKDKKFKGSYFKFLKFIKNNNDKYNQHFIDIYSNINEEQLLSSLLPNTLYDLSHLNIKINKSFGDKLFDKGPWSIKVIFD